MAIPLGKWQVNVNGSEGELMLQSVDPQNGKISGQIFSLQIHGFWDEGSQTITFYPQNTNSPVNEILPQIYRGYLFSTPTTPQPGQDLIWTLAGSVEDVYSPFSNARRNVFGWFAHFTQVI